MAEYAEFMSVLALALHPLRVPARQTIITQVMAAETCFVMSSALRTRVANFLLCLVCALCGKHDGNFLSPFLPWSAVAYAPAW